MTINRTPFRCQVCSSELFFHRKTSLERAPHSWMDDEPATGLVCERCGYVHVFQNNAIELWTPEGGYPR